MEIEQKELTILKGQVTKLEVQSQSVTIETQEQYAFTVDLVSKLKETGKLIKEKKESITKPLNEALRNARELFAPLEEQFAKAEIIVKTKLLDYKRQKDAEARAEESKIAARVERGTLTLPTAERKIDSIERVSNTTKGSIGEVQIRKVRKVRIEKPDLLPREYLVPNESLIRADALSGKSIPGVIVFEEEIIAAR